MARPLSRSTAVLATIFFLTSIGLTVFAGKTVSGASSAVLAAPMYNFAIPSTLKAWLDHVLRAGVTFKYTETGPQGLLTGKRAIVLTARGGVYAGGPLDHQEPYLRQALAFIGIHDVQFIHAEGLNMGEEFQLRGLATAREAIGAVA